MEALLASALSRHSTGYLDQRRAPSLGLPPPEKGLWGRLEMGQSQPKAGDRPEMELNTNLGLFNSSPATHGLSKPLDCGAGALATSSLHLKAHT